MARGWNESPNDTKEVVTRVEDDRSGMSPVTLARAFYDHLHYTQAKTLQSATAYDEFMSLAFMVRDRLVRRWSYTQQRYHEDDAKRVYYLSAEFLLGRALASNLISLGIYDASQAMLAKYGVLLADVLEQEPDAGLGNGGLGRLAACYLDSMATLGIAGYGYGIRYQYGIFEQVFRNGFQRERPETWLQRGNPWEIKRPERRVKVDFYGRAESYLDDAGQWRMRWVDTSSVYGMPYDTPIAGFGNETVNTLRLWEATSSEEFDLELFNDGDYERAVAEKNQSEVISKVLYPNDKTVLGKELRLKQQYFFVRCALADIVRRHLRCHPSLTNLAEKAAIQLNDTHPAIAIAELMRILVDEHGIDWTEAWHITRATVAYTNHTVLSEALECWSVDLLGRLLPRHLQIVFEINRRFLNEVVARWPTDGQRLARMSLIEEGSEKRVRMAHLAIVGSHRVNGVAELHTDILRRRVFRDFHEMDPKLITCVTNGVTPRRWLLQSNPALAAAITDRIGSAWVRDLDQLERLEDYADDPEFHKQLRAIKHANKKHLAVIVQGLTGTGPDPCFLFDMHIKRIHEYKRQLLNVLHIIALYLDAKESHDQQQVPRAFFFGGKAAPGYQQAKLIIKLINSVAQTIASDYQVRGLSVHFLPNYRVSLAERMIPACDVSEQISTAGMEASGTGNMKLAMNGALTIGTLDGANVEIRQAVGDENFFLFGLTAEQVERGRERGYDASAPCKASPRLASVLELIESGYFCPEQPGLFGPLVRSLRESDPFRVLADFDSYVACQQRVSEMYLDTARWDRACVVNIAKMGRFSSDRAVGEYAKGIWGAEPVVIKVPPYDGRVFE